MSAHSDKGLDPAKFHVVVSVIAPGGHEIAFSDTPFWPQPEFATDRRSNGQQLRDSFGGQIPTIVAFIAAWPERPLAWGGWHVLPGDRTDDEMAADAAGSPLPFPLSRPLPDDDPLVGGVEPAHGARLWEGVVE